MKFEHGIGVVGADVVAALLGTGEYECQRIDITNNSGVVIQRACSAQAQLSWMLGGCYALLGKVVELPVNNRADIFVTQLGLGLRRKVVGDPLDRFIEIDRGVWLYEIKATRLSADRNCRDGKNDDGRECNQYVSHKGDRLDADALCEQFAMVGRIAEEQL